MANFMDRGQPYVTIHTHPTEEQVAQSRTLFFEHHAPTPFHARFHAPPGDKDLPRTQGEAQPGTLAIREQDFMLAARLSGSRGRHIILRHVIPNIMPQLMTFALLGFGIVIILEGALSFLGLGIPLPEPSWGSMIAQGQQVLSATPEQALIPSAFLFATVVSLNLLGDALRERWGVR